MNKKRGLVLVNNETQEVKLFESVNAAARFLGSNYANVQIAMFRVGGICAGWRVYEGSESILERIDALTQELEYVKSIEN